MASREIWAANARRLMFRRNLAAYLDVLLPAVLWVSGGFAAAIVLLRTMHIAVAAWPWWFAVAVGTAAVVSWFVARRKFLSRKQALAQLDAIGGLHNRLTAAEAGIGDWPEPRSLRDATRWRWSRLLAPVALSVVLVSAATWMPVMQVQATKRPVEQPLAWSQLDTWMQALEESKLVEQAALETLRQQLDELRQQPSDQWYNQSSLEAGDTLRDRTEQALRGLLEQLEKTDHALGAAGAANEKTAPAQLQALNQSLQAAAQAMEMGNLPLNKELVEKLRNFDAAKAKQLSASQLNEMREKVQAGAKVAEQCVRPGANLQQGVGADDEGDGGPGGGGGPAPLGLRQDPTNLRSKETATISNEDTSQALPGDLVGVQQTGEHKIDKVDAVPQISGGAIASVGEGGDAVRRESFTPRERQVLQRFFK